MSSSWRSSLLVPTPASGDAGPWAAEVAAGGADGAGGVRAASVTRLTGPPGETGLGSGQLGRCRPPAGSAAAEEQDGVGPAGCHRVAHTDVGVLGVEHVGAVDGGVLPPVDHPARHRAGGHRGAAGVPDDVLPGRGPAGADLGAVVRVVLEGLVGGHPLGPALGDLVEGAVALQGVEPVLCAVVVDHGADRAALAARAGAHRDLGVVLGGLT